MKHSSVIAAADASFERSKRAHADAKRDADTAAVTEANTRLLIELLDARARLDEAKQRWEKAQSTATALRELYAQIEANPINPLVFRSLQKLATAAREAELSLQSSATLIEFQPKAGRHVAIDGAAVEASSLTIAEPTRILLEGFGAIRVIPGGEELASLRAKTERTRDELAQALAEHGVATLQEAERRADELRRQEAVARTRETLLATHAAEGLEELRSLVDVLRARVDEGERAARDFRSEEVEMAIDVARERAAASAKRFAKCREIERNASESVLSMETQRKVAATALAATSARRAELASTAASLAADVKRAEAETDDDLLVQRREIAARALVEAVAAKERASCALRDSDPEGARIELKQATGARNAMAKQLEQARQRVNDFIIELRTLGEQDLAAQLETAEGDATRGDRPCPGDARGRSPPTPSPNDV